MADPYNLQRFIRAQDPVIESAMAELRAGCKRGHWMWFVFPQLRGLGHSAMADKYGIASKEEAEAYLRDPVLGPRLRECTRLVNAVKGRSIGAIFGSPDDMKFRSCMTLFAQATAQNAEFVGAIDKYFAGQYDPVTLKDL